MKTRIIALGALVLLCAAQNATAQKWASGRFRGWSDKDLDASSRWEIGLMGGATEYYGDLVPKKRKLLDEATYHGGAFIRYYLGENFSLRANAYVGKLAGDDATYDDPYWRKRRNFSFTSILVEGTVVIEYDVLHSLRDNAGLHWGAYAFAGIGLCYTNPQRNVSKLDAGYFGTDDRAVSGLDEDLSKTSKHVAVVAPLGLGVRYNFSQHGAVFIEGGLRKGFDDKIDGFKASVSSPKNDCYALFSFGLCAHFGHGERWWR